MTGSSPREAREELGRIAAELFHDLAADLEQVRGRALLLLEASERSEGAGRSRGTAVSRSEARDLYEETERLGRMLADILDWVTRAGPRTVFRPAEVLVQVLDRLRPMEGVVPIRVKLSADPESLIQGPASFFSRCASNLIRNALRHARKEVRVTLESRPEDGRAGMVLRVEDDGEGVDPELLHGLFTPGESPPSRTGHGLGLTSTAWLSAKLGAGTPRVGRGAHGASFEIWFPMSPVPGAAREAAAFDRPLQVAILDDDPGVVRLLTRVIERAGATVQVLPAERRSVDRLLEGSLAPDLLLLDRNLGFADGYDVWRELRSARPALAGRTTILTGGLLPEDAPEELGVLHKPISVDAFSTWLSQGRGAMSEG